MHDTSFSVGVPAVDTESLPQLHPIAHVRPVNRREVLLGLVVAPVLLSGCGSGGSASRPDYQPGPGPVVDSPEPEPPQPEIPSRARHFKPLEGQVFYIEHPFYGSLDAVMTPLEESHLDPQLEQFAVGFYLPSGSDLPEGTYKVSHHAGATFDIFLQPGGVAVDGYDHHRAIFSHLPE